MADEVQLPGLMWCGLVEVLRHRKSERAMVGLYYELASVQCPLKILGGEENGEKFAVIGGILLLSFLVKKPNGVHVSLEASGPKVILGWMIGRLK